METPKLTHVVLVSSPGLGHLIPAVELAKHFVLLYNFKVTVIAVTSQTSRAETQILDSVLTPSLCHLIDIPSPDITAFVAQNDAVVTRLCVVMREARPAIRSVLSEITPRPSAVIVDLFSTETIPIARELNILGYVFIASHAWMLALLLYSPVLDELVEGQYVDQTEPIKIPGCKPVRPEDVLDPMLDRNDRQYTEYLKLANGVLQSDGVLVNTWEELQREELEVLREGGSLSEALNMKIPIYAVGPLVREPLLETNSSTELLVRWLDQQPSKSVVYVSFGSGGTVSSEQMKELAWGLELSEQRFVWVVRPPTEGVADAAFFTTGSSGIDEVGKYLPEGFVSRTSEVGLLVLEWAQQVTILGHRSIGGFLSHCGWGSTLESVTNGVPLIAWPLYAEQRMNAALVAEGLGLAVRPRVLPTKKVVRREEIAEMVREVIEGVEGVKGNRVRERVKELQKSAMKAVSKGGSSYVALSQLANRIAG
ncbi:anthocyanidin 3-O-glucosyltransferase 5-like [Vigna unguiculata]|uniref:anthocyanidin 3-O-glucosyltransferase 5-like n=1 Tax=Vigna unguiculata TaxID=3917 RepID=UPI0010161050|nr:anthocyanidin 3-O-glucosyltransferase 5-like [Vigna unguiculata]